MSTTKTLRLYTSTWGEQAYETFKLFPISKEANFLEVIYDGEKKVLAIMGTFTKDSFAMLQKLDKDGNGVYNQDFKKVMTKLGSEQKALDWATQTGFYPYAKERTPIEGVNEYYLTKPSEIEEFIVRVAENADSFDYKKYLNAPAIVTTPEPVKAPEGLSVVQE